MYTVTSIERSKSEVFFVLSTVAAPSTVDRIITCQQLAQGILALLRKDAYSVEATFRRMLVQLFICSSGSVAHTQVRKGKI